MSASPARAAQACIDRFAGKSYEPGKRDCAIMAAHLLHQRGIPVPVMKGLKYSTEAGAVRALKRTGCEDIIAAVDALGLERIAPASARTGDLVGLPCDGGPWGCALTVAVGNGRLLGFVGGLAVVFEPKEFLTAWRVSCRK
jgi:hypothetical protein